MECRSTAIGASGARTAMVRIDYPVQRTHPKLQAFAVMAAWLSVLAETAQELEDLLTHVPPEERQLPDFRTSGPGIATIWPLRSMWSRAPVTKGSNSWRSSW